MRLDVHVLNNDGNLVDCASIAAISALTHFRYVSQTSLNIGHIIYDIIINFKIYIYGRFSRKHYKSAIFELSLLKPIFCIWNVDILKIKEEKQFLLIFINVRMVGVQTKRPKSCMIVRNTWTKYEKYIT